MPNKPKIRLDRTALAPANLLNAWRRLACARYATVPNLMADADLMDGNMVACHAGRWCGLLAGPVFGIPQGPPFAAGPGVCQRVALVTAFAFIPLATAVQPWSSRGVSDV